LEGFLDGPTTSGDGNQLHQGGPAAGVTQVVGQVGGIGQAASEIRDSHASNWPREWAWRLKGIEG